MGYQTHEMQPPALPGPWYSHQDGLALLFLHIAQTHMNSRGKDFLLPILVSLPLPKLKKRRFQMMTQHCFGEQVRELTNTNNTFKFS